VAYKTHIHILDNDSLLQIFSYFRQAQEGDWNLRLGWRIIAHVCRRWRHLIFDTSSHLDICLLLTNDSPSPDTLSHLPPLPLVIDYSQYSDRSRTIARPGKDEDNIRLGLQQYGRVLRVVLRAPSSGLRMWFELMNNLFPRLTHLSLLSTTTEEMSLVLPETLQAPDLRRLALHGIGLPKGFPLHSSTIALSTLSLTHIGASCYLPPGHLVTQLQGLPHLEELFIGFAIPIHLPSSEEELLPAPIPPVTLPTLRRLTFRGVGVYLDNLVAQINTPLLERLSVTLFFEPAFTLMNLTEFIQRTEGSGRLVARVIFDNDGPSIDMGYYEQGGIRKLSLHVNCEPLDSQIDSVKLVCSALGKVMSTAEELTLDLDVGGAPSDWENTLDNTLWHELLLPFVSVKKLHVGSSLALRLAQALESNAGGLVLPELQELEVSLKIDHAQSAFSLFIETRESMGRPVHLLAPSIPRADEKVLRSVASSGVRLVPRSEQERSEWVRSEREHLEQEHLKQERLEQEHLMWERIKQGRLKQEQLKQERLERLERVRLERERSQRERLERERSERECLVM
jgi:hypothetical protein